jgi:quercetin dioxygenase-like cupin family protein
MKLNKWNPETEGALTETALTDKLEKLGYRCTCYTYPRGTVFPEHSHSMDKIDAVLKGKFRITSSGFSHVLEPGDYVFVPANITHRAEVVGDECVVSLDAIKMN